MKEPEVETLFQLDAKIGGNTKRREIPYSFIEPLNSLYLEKTEIYRAQIHSSCRNLSKYIESNEDTQIIDKESSQLQITLNLQTP